MPRIAIAGQAHSRGLPERFYEYLLGLSSDAQVIIVENEHPLQHVSDASNVIVFTKNPNHGRYGFFPTADGAP